jgi:cysteine desulfuration protein SufE
MGTMTIDRLLDAFALLEDWQERYDYLSEVGAKLAPMPEAEKTEAHRVQGCVSSVWVTGRAVGEPPIMEYHADGEGAVVRGLVALVLMLFQDRPRAEVLELDAQGVIQRLGLDEHLSANRRMGLHAMIERFKAIARGSPA